MISILIPTRNRLDLLSQAVDSLRHNQIHNFEIVISDNASTEDIRGYVAALSDQRFVYTRCESPVSVTDNWNRALDCSTGEYVWMLGDDDGLLPGALQYVTEVVETWNEPEVIYVETMTFAHPGVLPRHPEGVVFFDLGSLATTDGDPYQLAEGAAKTLVKSAFEFEHPFPYNMQHFVFKRSFLERLRHNHQVFHSPYPDYYLALAATMLAESIVVTQVPVAIIGVSPKSFGFYYFNRRETEGTNFLMNLGPADERLLRSVVLPGSDMNTCWLLALEAVKRNFAPDSALQVNYQQYRRKQLLQAFLDSIVYPRPGGSRNLRLVAGRLSAGELARYLPGIVGRHLPRRWIPESFKGWLRVARGLNFDEFGWSNRGLTSLNDVIVSVDPMTAFTAVRKGAVRARLP